MDAGNCSANAGKARPETLGSFARHGGAGWLRKGQGTGFNGSRPLQRQKTPYQYYLIPVPCGRWTERGCPGLDRRYLKATWEKAAVFEEHPAPVGKAREITPSKQKPKLELEPCRKFGGCLVSEHLVNTSCGWRLTSSSTAPASSHAHRPGVCPGAPVCRQGTRGMAARRKHSAHRVSGYFFSLCKKNRAFIPACP